MLRDKSNMAVGLLLPAALILLFGYGLSFDVATRRWPWSWKTPRPAREAVQALGHGLPGAVLERQHARGACARARSPSCAPCRIFSRLAAGQGGARAQLVLNGSNSTTAQTLEGVGGAIAPGPGARPSARRQAGRRRRRGGAAHVVQRGGHQHLVPGARPAGAGADLDRRLPDLAADRPRVERGTLESLFVTPVRPGELVLAKLAPYLAIGAIDLLLCLLAARFLFEVPMRGSLLIIFRLDAVPDRLAAAGAVHLGRHAQPVPGQPDRAADQLHAGNDAVRLRVRPAQRAGGRAGRELRAARHALHGPDQDAVPGRQRLAHHPAQLGHPVRLRRWRWPGRPGAR